MRQFFSVAILACLLTVLPGRTGAAAEVALQTSPAAIAIDSLYNGENLTVTGEIPADSQLVIRLSGQPTTFHMKEKGKVLGVLWMNTDKVTFENAPAVFLVAASKDVPEQLRDKLGVPGLGESIATTAKDAEKATLVAEFLKFQKSEKLYRENAGQVTLGPDAGDVRTFTAVLQLPSRLSPGHYMVQAFAVKDGAVAATGELDVKASFVGIPAFMADMAFNHGTLYGILASIIAILGGLVISQIFRGSKSGAH